MDIIKEEVTTTIKTEMEENEINPNDGNYLQDNVNNSIKCEVTEENDDSEENYSNIQMDLVFVECKIEVDSDDESMDCVSEGQSGKVSKQKGVKYPCDECSKDYTNSSNLRQHKASKHEGLKYPCDQCDYKANALFDLKKHKDSKHEGVKYPCNECSKDYTDRSSLRKHKEATHKGVRYNCDQCDYKATQKPSLKKHIKRVHESKLSLCPEKSKTTPGKTKTTELVSAINSSDESSDSQKNASP